MEFKFVNFLLFLVSINSVLGQNCNICNSKTHFACFSETQYVLCNEKGEIDLNLINCAASQICIYSYTGTPCRAKSNYNSPTCNVPTIIIPPVWETTVPPTNPPTIIPTTVPPTNPPTIIPTTVPPTNPPTIIPTTVPTTTVNPSTFCSTQAVGRYAYGIGCKQYIYCYIYGGVMRGAIYSCVGTTLFSPTTQTCTTSITCVT